MRFRLPQCVIYWAPTGSDQFGSPALADPVEYPCRWEDSVEETIDAIGNVTLSSAKVFLEKDVRVGGMLMRGDMQDLGSGFPSDNPRQDRRVREIINKGRIPSLSAGQYLTTAMLK